MFKTLTEHWGSIDGYWIEKYLMLVWYLYKEVLHVVLQSHHALEVIQKFMKVIQENVLNQNEHALGISL